MLHRAEMPQVDHRVRQRFQPVVNPTDPFKTQQQPLELVLPREQLEAKLGATQGLDRLSHVA